MVLNNRNSDQVAKSAGSLKSSEFGTTSLCCIGQATLTRLTEDQALTDQALTVQDADRTDSCPHRLTVSVVLKLDNPCVLWVSVVMFSDATVLSLEHFDIGTVVVTTAWTARYG